MLKSSLTFVLKTQLFDKIFCINIVFPLSVDDFMLLHCWHNCGLASWGKRMWVDSTLGFLEKYPRSLCGKFWAHIFFARPNIFSAGPKDSFCFVNSSFVQAQLCRHKIFLSRTKCNSISGLSQKIWTDTKHFWTCRRMRHE